MITVILITMVILFFVTWFIILISSVDTTMKQDFVCQKERFQDTYQCKLMERKIAEMEYTIKELDGRVRFPKHPLMYKTPETILNELPTEIIVDELKKRGKIKSGEIVN